jgi:hypothetical protein
MNLSYDIKKPLCIDLYAGLGGWAEGFLAEGYDVIGFDIERHRYPARAIDKDHVKAKGADWNKGDSFNGTTEKQWRESPLTGGWDEYPGQLVLQDVLTLHGSQFRNAACIVASPPCQEFSYMAMPWSRAKAKAAAIRADETGEARRKLTALFDACFRIQREAIAATGRSRTCPECDGEAVTRGNCRCERCDGKGYVWIGTRHIPLVVENVKGAQPWVGRAKANYGSFYLWGDVESVGGRIIAAHQVQFGAPAVKAGRAQKFNPDGTAHGTGSWFAVADSKNRGASKNAHVGGGSWFAIGSPGQANVGQNPDGRKVPGMNFHEHEKTGKPGRSFQSAAVDGVKGMSGLRGMSHPGRGGKRDLGGPNDPRRFNSRSSARKAASAAIAKIPFELSRWIAHCFKPVDSERAA